jgi:hypothetical protein
MCLLRKTLKKEGALCQIILKFTNLVAIISSFINKIRMSDQEEKKQAIIGTLKEKSLLKQRVYDNTFDSFGTLKDVLRVMAKDVNASLAGTDSRIRMEYTDRSNFDAQLKVAGDILLFSMHSNIFQFDRDHPAWTTTYIQKNKYNAYSGMINIYNYLADSFRYSRLDDLGYLIARIFINHEKQYFVEGKRQM